MLGKDKGQVTPNRVTTIKPQCVCSVYLDRGKVPYRLVGSPGTVTHYVWFLLRWTRNRAMVPSTPGEMGLDSLRQVFEIWIKGQA